jgi:4-hydroxy-tetrahydrodipicolinate reductase
MSDIRLVIAGAAGRMGQAVLREAAKTPGIKVIAGLEAPDHIQQGKDLGQIAGAHDIGARLESAMP